MKIYNTLTKQEEEFQPVNPPNVGIYVCGPTVYGEPHLGHARPAITFDLLFRYLKHQGYKVRYIRNITDVGHLENDADQGEDKISKKARLEQLEPMEVAQHYTNSYHKALDALNCLRPSIEPHASGHIPEQIEMIQKILDKGYAYISNGSVYFDVEKYNQSFDYGILSGRVIEDLISNTRKLDGQEEKRNSCDFALWKKASPEHIMRWNSPWSLGFPGWHMECSAMGTKYLGEMFDIHGGGMDLLFPHHESEIAQSTISNGCVPAKYWMHNNMITINGQKMGKSLGNFITLEEFFTGNNKNLERAYSPMNIRFFILQAHYRSPLDFSNEALQSADKGLKKLMEAIKTVKKLKPSPISSFDPEDLKKRCYEALDNDLNSPILIANLFEAVKIVNSINDGKETATAEDIEKLINIFETFVFEILGLKDEFEKSDNSSTIEGLMDLILQLRAGIRERKDWTAADLIRDNLKKLNITVKDSKEGSSWNID